MTFRENFAAEQLFLKLAKEAREIDLLGNNANLTNNEAMERSSIGIVACAFAMEALTNKFLKRIGGDAFFQNERRSVEDKLRYLKKKINAPIDFGHEPWCNIREAAHARNWLAHYKFPNPALIGSDGYVHEDRNNTDSPRNDEPFFLPQRTLTPSNVSKYYESTLQGAKEIAMLLSAEDEFEFLWNENFEPFLYG